jgi:hypothetical protein
MHMREASAKIAKASLFAPQHARSIDVDDLRGYPMFRAVVSDSLLARLHCEVVINDAETPG